MRGKNNLETCYQYVVKDEHKQKIMTVKIYNKTLDLLGREGCKLVSNNYRKVLGSTQHLDLMQDKVRFSRDRGLTRVEVSVHF